MSFTSQVKHEIASLPVDRACCLKAELAGLARTIGTIRLSPKPGTLLLSAESPATARRVFKVAKELGWSTALSRRQYARPRRYRLFIAQLPLQLGERSLLVELGLVDRRNHLRDHIEQRLVERKCCRRAFLRGAFLGGGFINQPGRPYHLEILVNSPEGADDLDQILSPFGLTPGLRRRNEGYGIYFKEGDQVAVVLGLIGATQGMLTLEDSRVLKDMRNRVNRLVNCETSNLNKSVRTGLAQVALIKEIAASIGLASLNPHLRALAELRLDNPEASLADLGRLLDPPLGKSGVNHRFRELRRIAHLIGRHR